MIFEHIYSNLFLLYNDLQIFFAFMRNPKIFYTETWFRVYINFSSLKTLLFRSDFDMLNLNAYLLNYYRKKLNIFFFNNNSMIFNFLQIDFLKNYFVKNNIFFYFFKNILLNIFFSLIFDLIFIKDIVPNIEKYAYKFLKGIFDLYYDIIFIYVDLKYNIDSFLKSFYDFFFWRILYLTIIIIYQFLYIY